MGTNEAISILRGNCSRLIHVVDNREMDRIQDATEMAIEALKYKQRMEDRDQRYGER